ncbi:MAG: dihydroneopterin aldolase [Microbacteriaceae bacterium]|nr:dihydroneopterin aldolase [Microbacteriaceae bacterium]
MGLRVFAHHGVFDFERQNGQDFYIDASVWIDGDPAAFSDDLTKTVHYGDLAKGLVELTKNEPVDLLETLAQRLLDYSFNFGGGIVKKAKITVHKPNAPIPYEFQDVTVTVKAKRD